MGPPRLGGPERRVKSTETLIDDPSIRLPTEARVRVIEYTDPISIWCWGLEPTIRRLEVLYPETVDVEVRMGGLFEDFGPLREYWTRMSGGRWKESVRAFMTAVAGQHRMPMNPDAMLDGMEDFESTWPACIAVKAAELQGPAKGRRYLRRLREAALLEGRPIHRRGIQLDLAPDVELDPEALRRALEDGTADRAFRRDLDECRANGITGFPTLLCHRGDATVRIEGWVPWDVFDARLEDLDAGLRPRKLGADERVVQGILDRYGTCATREIAAILGVPDDEAEIRLDELAARDMLLRLDLGTGVVWSLPRAAPVRADPVNSGTAGP